jgi:hypothetical protein
MRLGVSGGEEGQGKRRLLFWKKEAKNFYLFGSGAVLGVTSMGDRRQG